MSGFRCVVFDFDGTLVDSNAVKHAAFLYIAARYPGGEAVMHGLLRRVQGDRHAVMTAFVQAARPSGTADELVRDYSYYVDSAVASASSMPGAESLLQALRDGGRQVVLSSATPLANLKTIVERRGWVHRFDHLAGSPVSKADTLCWLIAEQGFSPSEIAVVGDGDDDRASAAATGCAFFAVGEARGAPAGEPVFSLHSLHAPLMHSPASGYT